MISVVCALDTMRFEYRNATIFRLPNIVFDRSTFLYPTSQIFKDCCSKNQTVEIKY